MTDVTVGGTQHTFLALMEIPAEILRIIIFLNGT